MSNQARKKGNDRRKLILATAGTLTLAVLTIAGPPTAPRMPARQTPIAQSASDDKRPAFDAASIKPHKSSDTGRAHSNLGRPGGHVEITNSLRMLLTQAYNLSNLSEAHNSIFGAPDWADSELFDIEAEADGDPTTAEKRLMLQSLLADRFKLTVHRETRQRPIYALVMAKPGKPGPQLHPHADDTACQQFQALTGAPSPQQGPGEIPPHSPADAAMRALQQFPCGRVVGGLLLQQNDPNPDWSGGRNVTMETVAASIGGMDPVDRPIVNRTGVSGTFDFTVEWNTQLQDLFPNPTTNPSGLSLFQALREQLGLKLVPQTGPVQVLVIDHVERPSEN